MVGTLGHAMPVCSPTLLCWVAPGVSGSGRSGGWLLGGGDGAGGAPASHRSFSPPPLHIRTVAAATLATCRALWAVPARAPAAPPRSPPPRLLQPSLPRPWVVSLTPLSRPVRRPWLPGALNGQDVLHSDCLVLAGCRCCCLACCRGGPPQAPSFHAALTAPAHATTHAAGRQPWRPTCRRQAPCRGRARTPSSPLRPQRSDAVLLSMPARLRNSAPGALQPEVALPFTTPQRPTLNPSYSSRAQHTQQAA